MRLTAVRLIAFAVLVAGALAAVIAPTVSTITKADRSAFRIASVFATRADTTPATDAERALLAATRRARQLSFVERANDARTIMLRAFDLPAVRDRPAAEIVYQLDPAFLAPGGAASLHERMDSVLAVLPGQLSLLAADISKLRQRTEAGALGRTRVAVLGRAPVAWTTSSSFTFNPQESRSRGWLLLPDALGAGRCGAVFGPRQITLLNYNNPAGPCAWFAAFGPPGAGTKAWLDSTNYLGAVGFIRRSEGAAPFHVVERTMSQLQRERTVMQALSYGGNVAWLACLGGRPGACERLLLSPRYPAFTLGPITGPAPGYLVYSRFANGPPVAESFFATVLEDFGAERTARIWRSGKPLPEAFREATGEPLDGWLQRAMASYEGVRYHAGPSLRIDSLLMLFTLCGGLLFAALTWGRRPMVAAPRAPMAP